MNPATAALATIVIFFILLVIVAAYGVYAICKLQKEIDATEAQCATDQSTRSKLNEKRRENSV